MPGLIDLRSISSRASHYQICFRPSHTQASLVCLLLLQIWHCSLLSWNFQGCIAVHLSRYKLVSLLNYRRPFLRGSLIMIPPPNMLVNNFFKKLSMKNCINFMFQFPLYLDNFITEEFLVDCSDSAVIIHGSEIVKNQHILHLFVFIYPGRNASLIITRINHPDSLILVN